MSHRHPGRFADHIDKNSTFSFSSVRNLVLEEECRLLEGNTTLLYSVLRSYMQ